MDIGERLRRKYLGVVAITHIHGRIASSDMRIFIEYADGMVEGGAVDHLEDITQRLLNDMIERMTE